MKKLIIASIGLSFLFLLTACGQTENESGDEGTASLEPLEVKIDMAENAEPEEEIDITAAVTQDGEAVADANEVKFEIWKEGAKEESEMVEADGSKDGSYTITHTFEEEGTHSVTAHVTARDTHTMPTETIMIGSDSEESSSGEKQEENEEHAGHHHNSPVTAELEEVEEVKANKETPLTFSVAHEGEPLTEARVRLEIWKHGEDTRKWVDAEEEADGTYKTSHTFEDSGGHYITVHIENNDGLHEHVDNEITVQ
ncbi:FixH family protein [Alteribacillus sp. HJP-4]|uniref:FixH family protein n=1 Tax=Alteribacillus sp. HJP-4 TaxID=2775394 RepID=UPI0035CCF4F1